MAFLQDGVPWLIVDVNDLNSKFQIGFSSLESIRKMKRPRIGHLFDSVVEYIKLRCRQGDQSFPIDRIGIHIATIDFCQIHEHSQWHVRVDRALMLGQENMLIADDKTYVILDA